MRGIQSGNQLREPSTSCVTVATVSSSLALYEHDAVLFYRPLKGEHLNINLRVSVPESQNSSTSVNENLHALKWSPTPKSK